ncbi:MAG: response regulator [Deltaproteobacteria bacterium]|nr:response regulator [Deltaproteobacteria bacterium]
MTLSEPRTLLLVDDNESLTGALAYNLRKAGYVVITAADGVEALGAAEAHEPDVIVSDVEMPEMDGIQLCQSLRRQSRFAQTPFLFLTAHGGTGEKVAGLRCGADDYIVKPFELEELVARIDLLCQKREVESAPPQLRGKIEEISIPEVLQFLTLAGKQGLLHISRGRASGWVSIKAGTVADAQYDGTEGEEALVSVVALADGQFRFELRDVERGKIDRPATFAVMEATRVADERGRGDTAPADHYADYADHNDSVAFRDFAGAGELDMEALCKDLDGGNSFFDEPFHLADGVFGLTDAAPGLCDTAPAPVDGEPEPARPSLSPAASPAEPPASEATAPVTLGPPSPPPVQPRTPLVANTGFRRPAPSESTTREEPGLAQIQRSGREKETAAAPKAKKILFGFADEAAATRVLTDVAKAFRSEPPKGFGRGGVDFQRIAFEGRVIHLFSSRAEKKTSFLWEPILATADGALFLASTPADAEHLANFRQSLRRRGEIPFVIVTEGPAAPSIEARTLQSSRDVLAVFSELLQDA